MSELCHLNEYIKLFCEYKKILKLTKILISNMVLLVFLFIFPPKILISTTVHNKYYVPFASFVTAVALYWVLCRIIETGVRLVEAVAEERR